MYLIYIIDFVIYYILSRVDERIGFMTPQQPIELGANTDKVTECTLNDDF